MEAKEKAVALIVGGSSGMGLETAKALRARGLDFMLVAQNPEKLAAAKAGLEAEPGGEVETVAVDLHDEGQVDDLVARIDAEPRHIVHLVNAAGAFSPNPFLEHGKADYDRYHGLNRSFFFITQAVARNMKAQGGGAIVNISTYAAFEPEATFPVSGSMRTALASFTKLYADQFAADGIRINNVLPGFIDSLPETEERRARIPMGRYGSTREIADTVAFLLSDDASYITGQNIRVDGGITRSV